MYAILATIFGIAVFIGLSALNINKLIIQGFDNESLIAEEFSGFYYGPSWIISSQIIGRDGTKSERVNENQNHRITD